MDFRKYNSIENSYRQEFLQKIKNEGFWDEPFCVQEKVHGANFSFWTNDGQNFNAAKRTAFLNDDEKFYNFQTVLENTTENLKNLWIEIKKEYPDLTELAIFGELIGGNYPHKDVVKNKNATKIQLGVHYSPDNLFYAFDILIDRKTYLDVKDVQAFFEKCNFLYAKNLMEGSLEEALKYSNIFESTIYKELDLPKIDDNFCEGIVIKSLKNKMLSGGSRLILKNKNEKWSEKEKSYKKSFKKKEIVYSNEVAELIKEVELYVTENRLNNVISKIGEVSFKDFGTIMSAFHGDVMQDFIKDNQSKVDNLEKSELNIISKSFNKKAVFLVRNWLKR